MIVKRINAISCGKVLGVPCAAFGLLSGVFFLLASLLGVETNGAAEGGSEEGLPILFGFGTILLLPVFYGVLGFIGGVFTALLYNRVASFVGGIEVDFGE